MQSAAGADVLAGSRLLDQNDLLLEFMMNALRLEQGFSQTLFEQRTGLPLKHAAAALQQACDRGLLIWHDAQIRPSEMGRRHLNQLLAYFMSEEE
jgi:oxygen-independent coproporphyrinogen-3 oxidase